MSYFPGYYPEMPILQGNNYEFEVVVKTKLTGDPVDITGSTGKLVLKASLEDTDENALMVKTGTDYILSDPVNGKARFRVKAEDTAGIDSATYKRPFLQGIIQLSSGDIYRTMVFQTPLVHGTLKAAF